MRAWSEDRALRARITYTTDLASVDETVVTASTADEIIAAVQTWVDAFLAA